MYLNCNLKVKVHQRERKRGTVRKKNKSREKLRNSKPNGWNYYYHHQNILLTPNKKIITIKYATTSDLLGKLFLLQYS